MSAATLLKLLDAESARPLSELAAAAQLSPEMLQTALDALSRQGFTWRRVGQGAIQLDRHVDWLRLPDLAQLAAQPDPPATELCLELGSSNDVLLARSRTGSVHNQVLLAECQTAGRGRRGRSWVSPVAHNLYFSMGWTFQGGVAAMAGLSLAVGAAIADALASEFGAAVELKWPNDLYLDGAKFGGVLIDVAGDPAGPSTAIVGVGLNIHMPVAAAGQIDQSWTTLASHVAPPVVRTEVADAVLVALHQLLQGYSQLGFAGWRDRWQARDMLRGEVVEVSGSDPIIGTGAGVDPLGALRVATERGYQLIQAGDASLRKVG